MNFIDKFYVMQLLTNVFVDNSNLSTKNKFVDKILSTI